SVNDADQVRHNGQDVLLFLQLSLLCVVMNPDSGDVLVLERDLDPPPELATTRARARIGISHIPTLDDTLPINVPLPQHPLHPNNLALEKHLGRPRTTTLLHNTLRHTIQPILLPRPSDSPPNPP